VAAFATVSVTEVTDQVSGRLFEAAKKSVATLFFAAFSYIVLSRNMHFC
jgi:hypothetical protein